MKTIPVTAPFDYAFLDCPPSLGILMTNALAAADELIIPLQCEYLALEGLSKIIQLIEQIRIRLDANCWLRSSSDEYLAYATDLRQFL